jgi:RNA polymerase sigma factor (sigma-70 family)
MYRDAEAFAELVRRHSAMVYATCRRILRNPSDAEEAAQECFASLARRAPAERKGFSSLAGWLYTLATHRSVDRLRTENQRRRREEHFANGVASHREATWDDVQAYLDEAIGALPEKLRHPLVSHFLEGETHESIARSLGVPRTTVTSRVTRGIEQVRKALKRRGVLVSASGLASLLTVEASEATPATLTAALGKIALCAGPGAIVSGSAAPHALTLLKLGGVIMSIKKVFALAAILLIIAGGGYVLPKVMKQSDGTQTASGKSAPADKVAGPVVHGEVQAPSAQPDETFLSSAPAKKMERNPAAQKPETTPERLLSITGQVIDADEQPVENAEVSVAGKAIVTSSDERGRFRLPGLSAAAYNLEVFKTGQGSAYAKDVQAGSTDVVITLKPAGKVCGHIYDKATSQTIAGAEVSLVQQSTNRSEATALSQDDGSYSFVGIKPTWVYVVRGWYEGLASTDSEPVAMRGIDELSGIDIYLAKGHTVYGKVVDLDGKALANANVMLSQIEEITGRDPHLTGNTRYDGAFSIEHVAMGKYWPNVNLAGTEGLYVGTDFTMPADADLHDLIVVADIAQDGFVSGLVTDTDGKPIPGVNIDYYAGKIAGSAHTGEDGVYQITGLGRAEIVHLEVKAGMVGYGRENRGVPVNSDNVDFVLAKLGAIKGRVVDSVTLEPVSRFQVTWAEWWSWKECNSPTGEFELTDVALPEVVLLVRAEGYAMAKTPISLPPGKTVDGITVALSKGIEIAGIVVEASSGQPVPDARVKPIGGDFRADAFDYEPWWGPRATVTDAEGRFRLSDIEPGATVDLVAYHKGYAAAFLFGIVAGSGSEVKLVLSQGSTLKGNVHSGMEPVANAIVTAKWADAGGDSFEHMTRAICNPAGEFQISGLPAGEFWVCCFAGMPQPGQVPQPVWVDRIRIAEGETIELTIQLADCGTIRGQVTGFSPGSVVTISVHCPKWPGEEDDGGMAVCDAEGNFEVTGLRPGEYTVRAVQRSEPPLEAEQNLTLEPGQTSAIAFDLRPVTGLP